MNPVEEILKIITRIAAREGWLNDADPETDPDPDG